MCGLADGLVPRPQIAEKGSDVGVIHRWRVTDEAERSPGAFFMKAEVSEPATLRRAAGKCSDEPADLRRRKSCRLVEQRLRRRANQF